MVNMTGPGVATIGACVLVPRQYLEALSLERRGVVLMS